MSSSDETSAPETETELVRREWDTTWPFDPELMRLVGFINILDTAEIGLTLHVQGTLVSGMLISMARYYRLLVEGFTDRSNLSESSNPDVAAGFGQFFQPSLDGAEEALNEYRKSDIVPPAPRHIHLRYAQTLVPNQQPFTQNLWRGRLTAVDGWSIGNFGPIPPLDRDGV